MWPGWGDGEELHPHSKHRVQEGPVQFCPSHRYWEQQKCHFHTPHTRPNPDHGGEEHFWWAGHVWKVFQECLNSQNSSLLQHWSFFYGINGGQSWCFHSWRLRDRAAVVGRCRCHHLRRHLRMYLETPEKSRWVWYGNVSISCCLKSESEEIAGKL